LLAQDQGAFLDLVVNHVHRGTVLVYLESNDVLVRISDLDAARLRGLAGDRRDMAGEVFVSLVSLSPGVTYEVDEDALELRLTAQPAFLAPTVVDFGAVPPEGITYGHEGVAFLSYELHEQEPERVSAIGEVGFSARDAVLLGSFSRRSDGSFLRGPTSLTLDDRPRLRRLVIGDNFAGGGTLGSGAWLAGVSVVREFDLDPYVVHHPALGFSAVAVSL